MNKINFAKAVKLLEEAYEDWDAPAKRFERGYRRTPYTIMISVVLSFRTKDEVTLAADKKLFALADTPEKMVKLSRQEIEKVIYPVGFYRKKAQTILDISHTVLERFKGEVPRSEAELLGIKGIGPKAANIILESAFGVETVAVDIHVHRILNRWGFVSTKTPEESLKILKEKLTPAEQKGLNKLLVSFGQVLCRPVKPICSECPVVQLCERKL
ncbi:endonuclease III domain-containing protein [Hydrogenimonas cancrithermarum]|uniref:Endonuclease III n=1 Tax=Hydrogenimonas cancrithermarum TaxID=2993563 RepID=A0ABN6WV67_9BACT|nr:endonuclease III [Hydrogenimonas cancrithermarum]BDY12897.1 endonuclease III [Hydrogenimonas cancrithermarum]BDY13014.1 endonuclease III [Hydrogenimonas cancrithermarum]